MDPRANEAKTIFLAAIERYPPDQWGAYLDGACGSDADLRARVEELLRAHSELGSFHESPALVPTLSAPPEVETPPSVIGPYKLLQQIGEGGMGTVYMAEQTKPVERRVALKVIKPGMDSRQVIARFEAERQALAMMDHPNIAKVLDAGTTDNGRPYFVMELVKGVPITRYCDEHHLTPRERMELFVPVCQAVQHAHQKGIIHRDLKPSNVLIALYDGRPVPKVIDFGVAKATGHKLTDHTMFTELGQVVGTLEYMSPEQAEFNQLDIDTRSDIYSLGVLLYELLTGTTPFERKRLKDAALVELLRIIREEEPPRPSTRLSTTAELASIAANRGLEPKRLSGLVRGELDWIVMKALEKDRNRRYETANGLSNDVLRYLADEPVLACPPSAAYRFRKFARRNKVAFLTSSLVALALVLGTVVSTWQAIRATRAERLAETRFESEKQARSDAETARRDADAARDDAEAARDIADDQRERAENALVEVEQQKQRAEANFDKARRAVDEYLSKVTDNQLLSVPGMQSLRRELLAAALPFYAEFTQERSDDPSLQRELASANYRLGRIQSELGNTDAVKTANDAAIRLFEQLREQGQGDIDVQFWLAQAYFHAQRYDETVQLGKAVLDARPEHPETRSLLANTYNVLAIAESDANRIDTALKHHQQAFALRDALAREFNDQPQYLAELGSTVNNLGVLLAKQNKNPEALAMFERAVEYSARAYEMAPHNISWGRWLGLGLGNVAGKQASLGFSEAALRSYQRRVDVRQKLVFENPAVASLRGELCQAHLDLAKHERQLGHTVEANRSLRDARLVLLNIPHDTPKQQAELAGIYASLSQPVAGPTDEGGFDPQEQAQFANQALATLRQAIEGGYRDVNLLKTDKLFDPLRERDEFRRLLASLETFIAAEKLAQAKTVPERFQAVDLLRELAGEQPAELRHRKTLAATLHSIGVIQTGLKQFEEAEKSLSEALQLRQALRTGQPDDPLIAVDEVATRVAIGQLDWERARFAEGHRTWQECSQDLQEIAAAHRANQELQQRIASEDRAICNGYGRYGLWPLAGSFVRRSVEFRWVSSDSQAAEFAALLLLPENSAAAHEYLAALAAAPPQAAMERETFRITHLVRTAAMAGSDAMTSEELVSRARNALAARNDSPWWKMVLATALYRTGEFQEAQDLMGPVEEIGSHAFARPQLPYVKAIVAAAVGNDSDARINLTRAETLYKQACLESLTYPALNSLGLPTINWHELLQLQAQRREALRLIQREGAPDDPWQHLIQARGYRLIGEIEKSDAELAAAEAAALTDTDVWMARARLLAQWDDQERVAEIEWRKAVDLAGEDPMAWIHRGRWYAERGEHEQADADFAKAASLTPHELYKFLEAGWWVVGPYPPTLKEFCPPEIDPDPSQPVYVIDPRTGLSDQPVRWRQAAAGTLGGLEEAHSGASAYALAYVYSPDERTALMRLGGSKPMRIWCNGESVFAADQARSGGDTRIPIALRSGRNVLLLKSGGDAPSRLRLGDSAADRASMFVEQGLWDEAADAFLSDGGQSLMDGRFHMVLALTGREADFHNQAETLFNRDFPTATDLALTKVVEAVGTVENPVLTKHYDEILSRVQEVSNPSTDRFYEACAFATAWAALVLDRPMDAQPIVERLDKERAGNAALNWPRNWPIRALLAEKTGKHDEAVQWLERCYGEYPGIIGNNQYWPDRLSMMLRLRTAERLITGSTGRSETIIREARERSLREFASDPLVAAFHHGVRAHSATAYQEETALPYVARGKRLAELARFAAAEADFEKAVALAPDDHAISAARASFLADRGEVPRAADAFWSAVQAANAKGWADFGRIVEYELAQHEEVLSELLRRFPQNAGLNRVRGESLARRGLWAEARQSYSTGDRYWLHESCNAALSLLLGDEAGYERACRRQPPLLRQNPRGAPELFGVRQVEIRGLRPSDPAEAVELLRLLKEESAAAGEWRQPLFARGLARYRNGDFEGAIEALQKAQQPHNDWQRDAFLWPVLAMAHWQVGRHDEARKWLSRSETWVDLTHRAVDIPLSVGPHNTVHDWWLYAHVLHFEAKALIDGPAASQEALQLLATRAATRTREAPEKRMQASLARAEAAWKRAIEAAPADPMPLIQRGRWYAERGEPEKADADFARAAALTDQLNPFLEAGWWVVGPACRDGEFENAHPVESSPDPARPVAGPDGQTQLAWQPARTGEFGFVNPHAIGPPGVKYAVTYLYSGGEARHTLLLGGHGTAKVWLNGAFVGRADGMASSEFFPLSRFPVTLRPGRNTLLVKLSGSVQAGDFYARFPEGDLDRGMEYTERGLFAEASDLLERGLQSTPASTRPWLFAVRAMRAAGVDEERYARICRQALQRYGDKSNQHGVAIIVKAEGLASQRTIEPEKLVGLAEHRLVLDPNNAEHRHALGLALYRAGRDDEARQQLLDGGPAEGWSASWPLLALIHHRLGERADSMRWLERARAWYDQTLDGLAAGTLQKIEHWDDAVVLLREAALEVEGRPLPDDPRLHLWRARGWAGFGKFDKAEAELAAAAELTPGDHAVWLAIARVRQEWDQQAAAAEVSLTKAVELAGNDPLPLIQRGRWYAQRGDHERADADYAKAAGLTPHELNKFLEAGWWVASPYPAELLQFCPPELDPDPSLAVHVVDPESGLSDAPVAWRDVPSGDFGRIETESVAGAGRNASLYALCHVYSPAESTATLCIASSKGARVWVNGQFAWHFNPNVMSAYWSRDPKRFPIVLQPGRNTILVKGFAGAGLTLRLGDHPYDRGRELARSGLWTEAADLLEQGLRRSREVYLHEFPFRCLAAYRLAAGDLESVRNLFRELSAQPQVATNEGWKLALAHIGGMASGVAEDAGQLVSLAEKAPQHEVVGWRFMLPLAWYRAGRFQDVADYFARDEQARDGLPESALLLAMAQHQLGDSREAARWLEAGHQKYLTSLPAWNRRGALNSAAVAMLLREASQLVTGSSQTVDDQLNAILQRRSEDRQKFAQNTLDFDAAADNEPSAAYIRLARIRRLAEVDRLDEADSDFDQAAKLASNDVQVAAARGLYLADRGDVKRAADEVQRLFRIGFGNAYASVGLHIEGRLATRADLMAELLRRQPVNSALHRLQGDALAFQGRWDEARQSYTTGNPYWSHEFSAAAISALLDDAEGFRSALERVEPLFRRDEGLQEGGILFHRAWMQALSPCTQDQADERVLALQAALDANQWLHLRPALGLAQYRAGQFQSAVENLSHDAAIASSWHMQARAWPVLAMAHWRLGNHDTARRYLDRTENYLNLTHRASRQFQTAGGAGLFPPWWLVTHALHREARTLIDGPAAAAAELAALITVPDGIATPRLTSNQGVEGYLTRAVELAGDDPLPWIHRGRWYAERGEHEKSDADFAKAAALTPNELNKFLEGGWWVVGPYPPDLKEFCPPEIDPDPSQAVYTIDPQTGLSQQPVKWRPVATDKLGGINVTGMPGLRNGTAFYALARVYSPDERTVLLGLKNVVWDESDPLSRVWVNDEPCRPVRVTCAWRVQTTHYPLTLRPGSNALLIKTSLADRQTGFTARLGDHPLDRGIDLGRFGVFDAAVEPIDRACRDVPEWSNYPRHLAAHFALTVGDRPQYERIALVCYERGRDVDDGGTRAHLAWLLNLGPAEEVDPQQLSDWLDRWRATQNPPPNHYIWRMFALAKFRVGDHQQALDVLQRDPKLSESPHCRTIMALALHKLGRKQQAKEQLDKAQAWLTRVLENFPGAGIAYLPDFYPTFREAYQLIHGTTVDIDDQFDEFLAARRKLWDERDPLISAFDDAVRNAPGDANAYLARGRRLAELGRLDEAAADFNKAVELAPGDPQVLTARAVFYADQGKVDQAAADFRDSLGMLKVGPKGAYWEGLPLYQELAQRDHVLEQLESLRPKDGHPRMFRMILRVQQGDLDAAGADAEQLVQDDLLQIRAAVALLRGDHEQFAELRANRDALPLLVKTQLLSLAPAAPPLAAELLAIVREHCTDQSNRWHRRWLGQALFRAGEFEEAVATLESSLNPVFDWQCDACYWPLLAMAHHKLGHADEARKYLDMTTFLLELYRQMSPARFCETVGQRVGNPWSWLQTVVFLREARLLIEGTAGAAALQQEGRFADAAPAWQAVLDVVPNDPAHWLQLAECRLRLGEFDSAVAACTRSAEVAGTAPGQATALYRRGMLRMIAGELSSALEDLSAAIERSAAGPPSAPVEQNGEQQRCVAWLLLGDLENYRRRCRELLAEHRDSTDPTRLNVIVGCCKQHAASVDDWPEIVEIAERCARLRPEKPEYRRNLFLALCRAGRADEALQRVPELATESGAGSQLALALCELQLGHVERARERLAACDAQSSTEFTYWTAELRRRANEVRQLIAAAAPPPEQGTKAAEKGTSAP
jgi:tetratricopeptide (TPR) repeat protein/serine/threonine protein kinase